MLWGDVQQHISSVLVVFTLKIAEDEPMFTIVHSYVVLNQRHKKKTAKTANKYTDCSRYSNLPCHDFCRSKSRWWFQIFVIFTIWGRFPFWQTYFSNGLVQPPTSFNINATTKRLPTFGGASVRPGSCIDFIGTHSDGSGQTVVAAWDLGNGRDPAPTCTVGPYQL